MTAAADLDRQCDAIILNEHSRSQNYFWSVCCSYDVPIHYYGRCNCWKWTGSSSINPMLKVRYLGIRLLTNALLNIIKEKKCGITMTPALTSIFNYRSLNIFWFHLKKFKPRTRKVGLVSCTRIAIIFTSVNAGCYLHIFRLSHIWPWQKYRYNIARGPASVSRWTTRKTAETGLSCFSILTPRNCWHNLQLNCGSDFYGPEY